MNIDARLQDLKAEYTSALPGHIEHIYSYWESLLNNPADQEAMHQLLDICHKLSGTAASFGFTSLSHHTREIEHSLRSLNDLSKHAETQQLSQITDLIQQLGADY
ncbi:MAG: Hpt domain-containing protein [Thioalkalispiraceae bacterium]|jgi:HPt (histidine-containing phosphotransfer) domain-containing protein